MTTCTPASQGAGGDDGLDMDSLKNELEALKKQVKVLQDAKAVCTLTLANAPQRMPPRTFCTREHRQVLKRTNPGQGS